MAYLPLISPADIEVAAFHAQAGKGSATLSMAYAAAEFGNSCLRAMAGESNITECAYIESNVTDLPFFATKVTLGPEGVQVVLFLVSCRLLACILSQICACLWSGSPSCMAGCAVANLRLHLHLRPSEHVVKAAHEPDWMPWMTTCRK